MAPGRHFDFASGRLESNQHLFMASTSAAVLCLCVHSSSWVQLMWW